MCQCVSLSKGFYIFWGGREDSSPKLRDARALRSISTSPACENGNAPCTLGRWWGTWCDGIEGVMFIPRWAGGISKKVGFHVESLLQGNPKDVQFIQAIIRGLSNLVFLWKSQMAHLAARSLTTKCIAKKNLGKLILTIPNCQPHRHCQTYFSWTVDVLFINQPWQKWQFPKVGWLVGCKSPSFRAAASPQVSLASWGGWGVDPRSILATGHQKKAQVLHLLFRVKLQRGLNQLVRFPKTNDIMC